MNNKTIAANIRTPDIKANRVRRQGYIPGVVYGQGHQTTPIMIEGKSLNRLLREAGQNVFFEIAMENDMRSVRLREIQRDPVTKEIIHVDAQIINRDQRIKADIPIRIEGIYDTDKRGIALQRQKDFIQVEGLTQHIPSHVNVSVWGLEQGGNIRVGDLEISEELSIIDNTDEIIISAVENSTLDIDEIDTEDQTEDETEEEMEEQTDDQDDEE